MIIISKKIFVSDVWNLGCKGHENFEFIDVALNRDNLLFIDPCLLEKLNDNWSKMAISTINSFFYEFYTAYRNSDTLLKYSLLGHAREQNATRLGYGNGDNGKGNSPEGLIHDFRPLESLIAKINTIGIPQDITILIPGFAEDGFSDLLTNVIHKELNDFTLAQMSKYGIDPNSSTKFYTWDMELRVWIEVESPCYRYGKDEILLVPKSIVRRNYLFGVGQYFGRIILERKREENGWRDDKGKLIPKRELEKQLRTSEEHWKYEYAIDYSKKHNDALEEYHKKLPLFYAEYGQPLDNDKLDKILY
ncbi:hypothetical protein [Candidatus Clostridium stratigraminis]|uniref:Uncharacterized protein n=1 Tax=Candidatus Clostridium stratigraminis TaxID=3381661 RepID=A0ABW8T6S4_9CLOT